MNFRNKSEINQSINNIIIKRKKEKQTVTCDVMPCVLFYYDPREGLGVKYQKSANQSVDQTLLSIPYFVNSNKIKIGRRRKQ